MILSQANGAVVHRQREVGASACGLGLPLRDLLEERLQFDGVACRVCPGAGLFLGFTSQEFEICIHEEIVDRAPEPLRGL